MSVYEFISLLLIDNTSGKLHDNRFLLFVQLRFACAAKRSMMNFVQLEDMMEITIRKALPDDAYEYTSCHISCWQSAYRGIISDEYLNNMTSEHEQRTESIKKALSDSGDSGFYCVTYNNKIIGRLIFGKSRDEDKPDAGEIVAIYLLEEYWNKGYGRVIMNFALEALKHAGYNEVLLWVFEENNRARRFYEKFNFIFEGTKKEIQIDKPLVEVRYILNI